MVIVGKYKQLHGRTLGSCPLRAQIFPEKMLFIEKIWYF